MNIYKGVLINAIPLKNKLKLKQLKHSSRWLLTFPYQAFERPEQFVSHTGSILRDGEISTHLHRLKVRSIRAVIPASDCNIIALVNVRIPFASRWRQRLDEGEVILVTELLAEHVATEHTGIALAGLGIAIATQLGFQIHAQMRVVVPNFSMILFHFNNSFGKTSVSHEGPSAQRGK